MSGNCELGRGLRRREKNANKAGAERIEKPAPDARAAPPEAHESLIGRKTGEEVPLTGLSFIVRESKSLGAVNAPSLSPEDEFSSSVKEPLLVSKALPVFRPPTTSAPLATYHFCARIMISPLTLRLEALPPTL